MLNLLAVPVIESLKPQLKKDIKIFTQQQARPPSLAVVLVGDDPASSIYVQAKLKAAKRFKIHSRLIEVAKDTTQEGLLSLIEQLNHDSEVDAILVQLPLPRHIQTQKILNAINPSKDVDGLNPVSVGRLVQNQEGVKPCTPKGIVSLLKHYGFGFEGQSALIIGRSEIVGKPLAHLLLKQNMTVTLTHSKSKNIRDMAKNFDLVVCATGRRGILSSHDVNAKAWVIDVGINRTDAGISGDFILDVDSSFANSKESALTPVPGGVGPLTIFSLMQNTLELAQRRFLT